MCTGKTPDELAHCKNIEKERSTVAITLREKGLKILNIAQNSTCSTTFGFTMDDKLWTPTEAL